MVTEGNYIWVNRWVNKYGVIGLINQNNLKSQIKTCLYVQISRVTVGKKVIPEHYETPSKKEGELCVNYVGRLVFYVLHFLLRLKVKATARISAIKMMAFTMVHLSTKCHGR